jgi:hypothetical protein
MNKTLDISIETHGGLKRIREVHLPTSGQPIRLTVIDYDCSIQNPDAVIDAKGEPTLRKVFETHHCGWPMDRECSPFLMQAISARLARLFGVKDLTPAQYQELRHHAAAMQHIFQSASHTKGLVA